MTVSINEIKQIADLARISLNEETLEKTRKEMVLILDLIAPMQEVNTSGIEPISHPLEGRQRLRSDHVVHTDHTKRVMANAPSHEGNVFLVPKVIE